MALALALDLERAKSINRMVVRDGRTISVPRRSYTPKKLFKSARGGIVLFSFGTSSRKQRLRFHGCQKKKRRNDKKKLKPKLKLSWYPTSYRWSICRSSRPPQIGIVLTSAAIAGKLLGMVVVCRVNRRCYSSLMLFRTQYMCVQPLFLELLL